LYTLIGIINKDSMVFVRSDVRPTIIRR